ncbi:MAG: DnaD domain protein [Oscillospiraceae bacterium]
MKYKIGTAPFGKFFTVPCSAVENFLKLADDSFYKVLLCLLCSNSDTADIDEVAKDCGISAAKAEEAVIFWSSHGVVTAQQIDGVSAAALADEKTKTACAAEPIVQKKSSQAKANIRYTNVELNQKAKEDPEIALLFEEMQNVYGRPINGTETAAFVNLYEYYGYSVSSIVMIVRFCFSIGKKSLSYIDTVAREWAARGITEPTLVEKEIVEQTERYGFVHKAAIALGIECKLTRNQEEYISQWRDDGFSIELIDLAGERCRDKKQKVEFAYINGILSRWKNEGLMTLEAVEESDRKFKESIESKKQENRKTSYDIEKRHEIAVSFDPNMISFNDTEGI